MISICLDLPQNESSAVWDYSLVNISYFSQYPELKKKLYYVPLGITEESVIYSLPEAQQDYDILFYGDANCDRLRKFLQELQKEFSVRVSRIYLVKQCRMQSVNRRL